VVIRRTSTCVAGTAGCDAFTAGMAYFQASLCGAANELDSANPSDYYAMDTTTGVGTAFTKHKKDCATAADLRRLITRIYFVANNDNPGDGIPTLKRVELIGAGAPCAVPGATCFSLVPLVEGIENMQFEYGLDTNAIPDGAPDVFTADPDNYTGAGAAGVAGNWRNVVAARVNLLARNTQTSAGYTDSKVYTLGKNADATANTFTPSGANAGYKRHAFVAEVRMTNPAQRGITP
jgi:type IV pilus assembly protein PilW